MRQVKNGYTILEGITLYKYLREWRHFIPFISSLSHRSSGVCMSVYKYRLMTKFHLRAVDVVAAREITGPFSLRCRIERLRDGTNGTMHIAANDDGVAQFCPCLIIRRQWRNSGMADASRALRSTACGTAGRVIMALPFVDYRPSTGKMCTHLQYLQCIRVCVCVYVACCRQHKH